MRMRVGTPGMLHARVNVPYGLHVHLRIGKKLRDLNDESTNLSEGWTFVQSSPAEQCNREHWCHLAATKRWLLAIDCLTGDVALR